MNRNLFAIFPYWMVSCEAQKKKEVDEMEMEMPNGEIITKKWNINVLNGKSTSVLPRNDSMSRVQFQKENHIIYSNVNFEAQIKEGVKRLRIFSANRIYSVPFCQTMEHFLCHSGQLTDLIF